MIISNEIHLLTNLLELRAATATQLAVVCEFYDIDINITLKSLESKGLIQSEKRGKQGSSIVYFVTMKGKHQLENNRQ